MSSGFTYLTIAIIAEVAGTLALKASNGFQQPVAGGLCVLAYVVAFYMLSLVVKTVPVGIAYAIWAGAGIVLITALSAIIYRQFPDLPAVIGIVLILAGVVIINMFSRTVSH
ncbi:Multidrug resistance protein EbrA [Saliniradius amylolyticus]|uniref:Multidrug resistance protein EbrA n=1 Tax=Saliniradius amylolyticus TaxID=2183582 RepID=A0A2S2E2X8_9ALTE|nr:multidrug efflux SMR transporter [Saliniradius amylolyticus]AWL11993.1 Multidrug resistance protein EbrA [Saliniradius amylolyticus]